VFRFSYLISSARLYSIIIKALSSSARGDCAPGFRSRFGRKVRSLDSCNRDGGTPNEQPKRNYSVLFALSGSA
jgi:hypothetical protein